MHGAVLAIERCSMQDGPGIRTTVFLKGCPLRCAWCHNPESWNKKPVLYALYEKCTGCGACINACPDGYHSAGPDSSIMIDRTHCTACGKCVEACPNGALEIKGRSMALGEVMEPVTRDKPYYENSGGGITVSGGEPLQQHEFASEILRAAKAENIHTVVETCGYGKTESLLTLAEQTDQFYYDIKETDRNKHREFTGVDNELILKNLFELDKAGKETVLRCPLIPGFNMRDDHLAGIADIANKLKHVKEIHFLGFHAMGNVKFKRTGMGRQGVEITPPTTDELEDCIKKVRERTGISVVIG